jgi:hypothetical protein
MIVSVSFYDDSDTKITTTLPHCLFPFGTAEYYAKSHILRDFEPGVGGRGRDSINATCALLDSSHKNSGYSARI